MRDKLIARLGRTGDIIWRIIELVVAVMPIIAIGGPWWLTVILIVVVTAVPLPLDIPLWIWGLVHLLRTDPAGAFSIVYYVLMAVVFGMHVVEFIIASRNK